MLKNHFSTNDLILEPLKGHHARDFFRLVMSNEVMQYITGNGLDAIAANKKFRSYVAYNQSHDHSGYFAVFTLEGSCFTGVAKLVAVPGETGAAEVGYMLLPEWWNRGYATQITEAMLNFARSEGIDRVIAIIDRQNAASRKVLQKFGFSLYRKVYIEELPAEYYELLIN